MKKSEKKVFEAMKVNYVGQIRDVIQLGGGKLSAAGGDPGEPRKPRGIENKL